jgi:stage II sporulation protein D
MWRASAAAALVAVSMALPLLVASPAAAEVAAPGPLRISAPDGAVLEVSDDARGSRRYFDTIEVRAGSGEGSLLINDLSMDDYVAGVAEMPARWPLEALKAQAVAARTYAWRAVRQGTFTHYDICATVACQVFRGADTVLEPDLGARWRQAVDETSGEVLVDDAGLPILARYFSTSGGRTYDNAQVFPDEGPRPFLVGTDDPYDAVSPYHRWTVRFSREQFDDILGRGDTLRAVSPVGDVQRDGSVHDPFADIVVTGRDGGEVRLPVRRFREFVSRLAAQHYPAEFPGVRGDGLRRLPDTLPSSRFEIEVTDDAVVIEGRGWGHGVGMSQYGALGRAEEGHDHVTILAAYYDGLEPARADGLPDRVRVGLDVADTFTVRPSHSMRVVGGDRVVAETALGTWQVTRDGDAWRLQPPAGYDDELEVSPTRAAQDLSFGDAAVVEAEVNKPVLLRMHVRDAAGAPVVDRDLGAVDAGRHTMTWRYDDADGAPVAPGTYAVTLLATDAQGAEGGSPHEVEVDRRDLAAAHDEPRSAAPPRLDTLVVPVALAAGLLLLIVLVARRSRA